MPEEVKPHPWQAGDIVALTGIGLWSNTNTASSPRMVSENGNGTWYEVAMADGTLVQVTHRGQSSLSALDMSVLPDMFTSTQR